MVLGFTSLHVLSLLIAALALVTSILWFYKERGYEPLLESVCKFIEAPTPMRSTSPKLKARVLDSRFQFGGGREGASPGDVSGIVPDTPWAFHLPKKTKSKQSAALQRHYCMLLRLGHGYRSPSGDIGLLQGT